MPTCYFTDSKEFIIVAGGKKSFPINEVDVIFTNQSISYDVPRAPLKVEFAVSFLHNRILMICGGRTTTSEVLRSCYALNLNEDKADEYLLWKSKSRMIQSVLYSAGDFLTLPEGKYFWLAGAFPKTLSFCGIPETFCLQGEKLPLNQESNWLDR